MNSHYERHFLLWVDRQAEDLRDGKLPEAAASGVRALVEDIVAEHRAALQLLLQNIIAGLLSLELGTATALRAEIVAELRAEAKVRFENMPGLRRDEEALMQAAWPGARDKVEKSLRASGIKIALPGACPFTPEQLVAHGFFTATERFLAESLANNPLRWNTTPSAAPRSWTALHTGSLPALDVTPSFA